MTQSEALKYTNCNDSYISEVFKLIADKATFKESCAGDSSPLIHLPSSAVEELGRLQYDHVQSRYLESGQTFETPDEAYDSTFIKFKLVGDGIINPVNKVGTLLDPEIYTHNTSPVMFGPTEGSLLYSNGGLPAQILDKKSRAMVMHGATFKAFSDEFWNSDRIEQLEAAADATGFNDSIMEAVLDSFIYGGSIIYPVFTKDSPNSFSRPFDKMSLEKDCISRWVTTDRWNTTIVPSYDVTAADYLRPRMLFIPISSLTVNTSRIAMLKPKGMPYWAALYNLGWSPSDATGWIRSYFGYKITCMSVPVMAQQMSLILYRMPLDALNATIGPDNVEKLMRVNEQKMTEWSSLSPKAVNMVGEVEVVDRTYTGLEYLFAAMKGDLSSSCGIPEPALWHTPNKGFSDNTTESLLKQSETLQLQQRYLQKCITPCTDALIAHVFGQSSEEWKRRREVRMTFDKPLTTTATDLAESGARFAASVASMAQAGVSPNISIEIMKQFSPQLRITQEMLNEVKKSYDDAQQNNTVLGGGQSAGSFSKAGNAGKNASSGQKSNSSANKTSTR